MPRVICELPNASDEISGVKFHPLEEGGRISDEIDQNTAELFASIPGYVIDEDEREPVAKPVQAPAPTTRKSSKKAEAPKEPDTTKVDPAESSEQTPPAGTQPEAGAEGTVF